MYKANVSNLSSGPHKKIELICDFYQKTIFTEYRYSVRTLKKFGKNLCQKCAHEAVVNSGEYRDKMSNSRKKEFREDPEFAERHAQATAKSWADGKTRQHICW